MLKENVLKKFSPLIKKVWLSSPTMHGEELKYMQEAYETNWMSTVGENINEVERIFRQGRLTPNQWMILATGSPLTVEPMLEAVRQVIK